jgi:hypothetical protein
MRALGPGSVSSFLKIILDVVFVALAIGAGVLALTTLAAVIVAADPTLLDATRRGDLKAQGYSAPLVILNLGAGALYIGGVLIIVERLRRIFATLTAGDPFHPDNVRRLRAIGLMLGALELGRHAVNAAHGWLTPHAAGIRIGFNPTAWFAVLVVFVLAEVFREGARLRREAELTI